MREKLPEDMKWVVSKAHIGLYVGSILLCVSLQAARLLSPEYSRQALLLQVFSLIAIFIPTGYIQIRTALVVKRRPENN
jgi:hypothetical protein